MGNKIEMVGKRFGKLTVVAEADKQGRRLCYLCKCDCGNETVVLGESLRAGKTKSCGCYNDEKAVTHGMRKSKLYEVWRTMKKRCEKPGFPYYERYGGRGIKICEEWQDKSNFFDWAMQNGYEEGLQIDRIDNDGDYCPENCRWVTPKVNSRNTCRTVFITYRGETKSLQEWAEIMGIHPETLRSRHKRWNNLDDVFRELSKRQPMDD